MLAGAIPNSKLAFSYITLTSGAGIGISVASPSLGGSTVISNYGVTSITTGTGVRVSASTGTVQVSFANDAGYLTSSTVRQYALTNIAPNALNSTTHIAATVSGTTATIITDATTVATPNTIVVRDQYGNINVGAWTINTVLTATNYSATVNDYWIGCSAKNLTISLPQTASQGRQYIIVDTVQSGSPGDTITALGGTTVVGGALSQQGQSKMCVFHGTTWYCN
jgi:propanediol dehydratase small subunit